MLHEPLGDARRGWLELPRDGHVENARPCVAAVFEVVSDASGDQPECAFGRVSPLRAHEHAHGAFDDVEDAVLGVAQD